MKKLLLCISLILNLCLVGCNNNINNDGLNIVPNDSNLNNYNQSNSGEDTNSPITQYPSAETDEFSEKSGFKVELSNSLKDVKYNSVLLMNDTTTQLDLVFPDKTKGTLIIDSINSKHVYEPDDVIFIDEIKVSIKVGADGIRDYEWKKNDYTFVYSTKTDIQSTNVLRNLINDISLNIIKEN